MHNSHLKAALFLGAALTSSTLGGRAEAAEKAKDAPTATVQELVVTAQRVEQNLLSVPQSVTAFTGEQLNNAGIEDLTSLQFTTPGYLPMDRNGSTLIYIRGIGNGLFTGADPSVATYVDDVPRIWGQIVDAVIDVERVEVLKGAQGGLYGRNATGGVLSIITRQPSTAKFEGDARISYGSRDTFQAAARINLPISEKVAATLSVQRESHDYYAKNVATSSTPYTASMFPQGSGVGTPQQTAAFFNSAVRPQKGYGNQDLWSVNGKLLVEPSDHFRVTIAGDYNHTDDTDNYQSVQRYPAQVQGVIQSLLGAFGFPATLPPGFAFSTDEKFKISNGFDPRFILKDYGGSATAVWNAPNVDVTSITAYRRQFSLALDQELGAVNVPFIVSNSVKKLSYVYQELKLATTSQGPWHILAGATYLNDHFNQKVQTTILPPIAPGPPTVSRAVVHNWSVYAQVRRDLTDALNITASGRYIHESNDTEFLLPTSSGTSSTVNRFLPSVTLSYQFETGGNAYARWARGFKGGGVNPVVPPSVYSIPSLGSVFGPESVDTYEIGYRAPLFDRTVQVTSAIYYNDYKGLQTAVPARPQFPALTYNIINAGSARTYGAEASVVWRVSEPVTLGVSGGYLNAKYKDFKIQNNPVLQSFDQSGRPMRNSPKWQLSGFGNLDAPINDDFHVHGSLLVSYISKIYWGFSGLPGVLPDPVQKPYWMVNVRGGLATADGKYGAYLFANNLFNQAYSTGAGSSGALGETSTYGRPRIVGVELVGKF